MQLADVPTFAGVIRGEFSFPVTGKAGGTIVVGSPVESADGKEWTALTGDPTDLAGSAVFDQRKSDDGYVLNDTVTVMVVGIISVTASAAIAAGARLTGAAAGKVVTSADPGAGVTVKYLGVALSDAAGDGDIIFMLVMPQYDTGT